MKLEKIIKILNAKVIVRKDNVEVKIACGSDLLSDVLSFTKSELLLLTGITNSQVVRTAEMAEIIAICFVRGKQPQADTVKLAKEKEIPLIATNFSMYEACGRLYENGLHGYENLK